MSNLKLAAEILRQARVISKIGLAEVSAQTGFSSGYLSRVERGVYRLNTDHIHAWSVAVRANIDEVYCAAGIVPPDIAAKLTTNVGLLAEVRELIS